MNVHSSMVKSVPKDYHILDVKFNQDQGCFAVAHENGFLVYNSNPIDLRVKRHFTSVNGSGSGLGLVQMLHRTNYLALVGGGRNPRFPNNKVIIWDDLKRKASLNLSFMSPVLNVLLSRIRIVVVLENQVFVYEFSASPNKLASYDTYTNSHGLADLSVYSSSPANQASADQGSEKFQILAFPGRAIGQIQLVDVSPEGQEKNLVSIIKAHKASIRCISLNRTGTMVASASETGTIIRIHSTHSTALLFEFRRGLDRAAITSMKFSPNDKKLAVLSDKHTLHVFDLGEGESALGKAPTNRRHMLGKLQLPIQLPTYFQSTWSFCSVNTSQYQTDEKTSEGNDVGTIGWSGNSSMIIVWKEKQTWEKYSIVAKDPDTATDGGGYKTEYGLVRTSWKSLEDNSTEQ